MMKILKALLMLSLIMGLVSCSGSKTSGESDDLIVDSEFIDDEGSFDDGDLIVDSDDSLDGSSVAVNASDLSVDGSGEYVVQKGDTLMWIAFKIYGDYSKWKTLRDMNGVSSGALAAGSVIKYNPPSERFEWEPSGEPHLIQWGETLGTISRDKYGTKSRWKDIWDNNRPMIKDPNIIFAGFTLYYVPGAREMASEL